MAQVQFIQTTPQELQQQINEGVKIQLQEFLKHFAPIQPKEYLTRSDVAKMFSVDISTVSNWQKSGKLKPLGISGRVYFLRSEVEASLKPLNV
ncbi:MAG: helix-turn-helix domain-containing protein [Flavobacterium sp.]|nr:helix-turn-helix domain-containing protein [Flavobacterium sp.]